MRTYFFGVLGGNTVFVDDLPYHRKDPASAYSMDFDEDRNSRRGNVDCIGERDTGGYANNGLIVRRHRPDKAVRLAEVRIGRVVDGMSKTILVDEPAFG